MQRARRLARDHPFDKDALDLWMEFAHHHALEGAVLEVIEACESLIASYPDYGPAYTHLLEASFLVARRDLIERRCEGCARGNAKHFTSTSCPYRLG